MNFESAKKHCLAGGKVRLPDWADVDDPKDAAYLVASEDKRVLVKATAREAQGEFLPGLEELFEKHGQNFVLDSKGERVDRDDWEECDGKAPPAPEPDPAVTWNRDREEDAADEAPPAPTPPKKKSRST
jgi:hypothetical protein